MAIKKEEFFEIIQEVSERKDLSSDNVLKKVQDKLKEKSDENGIDSPYTIVYNIFKSDSFYKNHEFKLQMPDGTTARGTLLHFAVQCGDALMVKLLLENKVSVTMKDHSGLTPLDIATSNSDQEIVHLLDAKANSKLEKNKDKTPRDIIIKTNKTPEGLVVNGNNATAALENGNKRTSLNSTDGSSDSTVDEQYPRINVKSTVEKIELSQTIDATYSDKRIPTDKSDSEDSGLELGLETASNTSSRSEINHDGANHVEENVDNQTLENALRSQKEENESLKQKIQDLGNKNTKLKDKLDKTESQYSKAEALLEKTQKELEESKSCIAGHETKLKQFNKENESLKQKIKSLENENTPLKSELGKTKTKTNKLSLEKVGKRQFSPKVAYASLAAMLVVGAALSIASGLSAPLIVAASVVSALIAGGITYAMSTKPDTELKEVDIQGSAQHGVCKT